MVNYVGYKDAQTLSGLKLATLYTLVHQKRIPHTRIGPRLVLFSVQELKEWLEKHRVPNVEGGINGR